LSGDLTLYRILGLRPDSDTEKIRTAYRKLAKRFHPDVNVTDASAEQRTKAINRAYQVLGNPEERAAYDRDLERQRADARARFWKGVAAGVATFVLMVGLVSLATTLIPYSILPPVGTPQRVAPAHPGSVEAKSNSGNSPSIKERATDELVTVSSLPPSYKSPIPPEALPTPEPTSQQPPEQRRGGQAADVASPEVQTAAEPRPRALAGVAPPKDVRPESDEKMLPHTGLGDVTPPTRHSSAVPVLPTVSFAKPASWTLYVNTNAGFALRYPADVFTLAGADVEDQERLLLSKDRRAVLRISSAPNNSAITLTEYRRLLMERRYAGAKIDYTLQQGNWFVLSGTAGEETFYERITFSCDNRSIHGWLLVYPMRERPFYGSIVEEIDRSYRYLNPKITSTVRGDKCASSERIRKQK
jgi:curved DNA-binding protein CbpA